MCITSITLSLTIYSHSACEGFSYLVNLLSSDRTTSPVSINDSTYAFNGLAPNTLYNVTVTINDTKVLLSDFRQVFSGLKTHSFTRKFSNKIFYTVCSILILYVCKIIVER